ncbi:MAG: hypothetical protein KF861_02505 [Planctomycetaceae bacterium]|nr:hypothetical protein [Planctomycetaceae bacterium]
MKDPESRILRGLRITIVGLCTIGVTTLLAVRPVQITELSLDDLSVRRISYHEIGYINIPISARRVKHEETRLSLYLRDSNLRVARSQNSTPYMPAKIVVHGEVYKGEAYRLYQLLFFAHKDVRTVYDDGEQWVRWSRENAVEATTLWPRVLRQLQQSNRPTKSVDSVFFELRDIKMSGMEGE